MRRGIVALIGIILALVFILVGLVGPWYGMSTKTSYGDSEASISLTATTMTSGGVTQTKSHADARAEAEKYGGSTEGYDVVNTTFIFTILAFILSILALVFILGYMFMTGKENMMKNLGMIFSILTFVLALIAVFYFMVALPGTNEMKDSAGNEIGFWYSESISGTSISYGPGISWYLMLIGAIFGLIAAIFLLKEKTTAPMPAAPQPPQQ